MRRASCLLAKNLRADLFLVSTAVEKVAINFGQPNQEDLGEITLADAKRYLGQGHFPPGSMGPKIEAAIRFLEGGGRHVIIGHLTEAMAALKGETGTHIVPE